MADNPVLSDRAIDGTRAGASDAVVLSQAAIGNTSPVTALQNANQPAYSGQSWIDSGNLIGPVPVREILYPPNIAVVEDFDTYMLLLSSVLNVRDEQKAIYESFRPQGGIITDYRYWFAYAYYNVTDQLLRQVQNCEFNYPSYVLLSILYFKKVYKENLDRLDSGQTPERQWQTAFSYARPTLPPAIEELCVSNGIAVGALTFGAVGAASGGVAGGTSQAIVGAVVGTAATSGLGEAFTALINVMRSSEAHLRYDLPRCLAWIYTSQYPMNLVSIGDFHDDFFIMADAFRTVTGTMQAEIYRYSGALLTNLPTDLYFVDLVDVATYLANGRTLAEERQKSWDRGVSLVTCPQANMADPFTLKEVTAGNTPICELVGSLFDWDNLDCYDAPCISDPPNMDATALFDAFMYAVSYFE